MTSPPPRAHRPPRKWVARFTKRMIPIAMGALYLVSVWLHVLAATTWMGGMIFLVLVVVPALGRGDRAVRALVMRESGRRFRTVGWMCFALLIVTGAFNAWWRGVRLDSLTDPAFLRSTFGQVLAIKLAVFALVLGLSAYHDFVLGPRASEALSRAPTGPEAEHMRRRASWLGRLTALLALAIFALAVVLVRGKVW